MFKPEDPELSSDLEWMLQSGQADNPMLAEALVEETYRSVYQFSLSYSQSPIDARKITAEIYGAALCSVYRFPRSNNIRLWLYRRALEVLHSKSFRNKTRSTFRESLSAKNIVRENLLLSIHPSHATNAAEVVLWNSVDSLPEPQRTPVLLHYLLDWPATEIAGLLGREETAAFQLLATSRERLLQALDEGNFPVEDLDGKTFDEGLSRSLKRRWPLPEYPAPIPELVKEVLEKAGQLSTRKTLRAKLNEMMVVGLVILAAAGVIWSFNTFFPEPAAPGPAAAPPREGVQRRQDQARPRPTRTPMPSPSPVRPFYRETFPDDAIYTVQEGDTYDEIALRLGVDADHLRQLNRVPDHARARPGQMLLIPGRLTPAAPREATPVPPAPTVEPLTENSTMEEIEERFSELNSLWPTFWFDARVRLYGPPGYIGSYSTYRIQFWLAENSWMSLSGPDGDIPSEVFMISPDTGNWLEAYPDKGKIWFREIQEQESGLPTFFRYLELIVANDFYNRSTTPGGDIRLSGKDTVYGRATLVLEKRNPRGVLLSRTWIDTLSAFPLKHQEFSEADPETLVYESLLTGIEYNFELPYDVFDPWLPWRGGYAANSSGDPELAAVPFPDYMLARHLPKEGEQTLETDLADKTLYFEYLEELGYFNENRLYPTNVYAGTRHLGTIHIPDPFHMICQRSSDGTKLAFTSWNTSLGFEGQPGGPLRWVSLSGTVEVKNLLPGLYTNSFAFSPDGRKIAVSAFEPDAYDSLADDQLFIISLEDGDIVRIKDVLGAYSLVFNEDGSQLAALTPRPRFIQYSSRFAAQLKIIDMNLEEVILERDLLEDHSGRLYPATLEPENWPLQNWGVGFPVEMGGLEDCSAPPK
jgi:DNA-directed RNA polymerase specialized sigma24 family protein